MSFANVFLKFNLELHEGKTRLIEFGRFAAQNRKGRGDRKPETFDFLGFTHICGKTKNGKYTVLRHSLAKRIRGKLMELKTELKRRLHHPVPVVGKWLRVVLLGHYRYYGIPGNIRKLEAFCYHVNRLWHKALLRRSQRHWLNWERMNRLIERWLPRPRIVQPYPDLGRYVTTRGKSPVRWQRTPGSVRLLSVVFPGHISQQTGFPRLSSTTPTTIWFRSGR